MPRLRWSRCALIAIAITGLAAPASAQRGRGKKVVTVGVVTDGSWQRTQIIRTAIEKAVVELNSATVDIRFPDDKRIEADWTAAGVARAIAALLADPDVDIVLGLGVLASNDLIGRPRLAKPVIAPFVIDPKSQSAPNAAGTSGRKNLSYLTLPWAFDRSIEVFREVTPFEHLHVLVNATFLAAAPGFEAQLKEAGERQQASVEVVRVGNTAESAFADLAGAEAVLIGPLLHLPPDEFAKLARGLIERKLPSFSFLGRLEVEQGVLAGIRRSSDFERIGRRVAVNVQRILLGDEPSTFSTLLSLGERLVINMDTGRKIGHSPSWAILTEAEVLNPRRRRPVRELTLGTAMKSAVDANPDLAAVRAAIAAAAQNIRAARAALLPNAYVSLSARVIDSGRAENSFGTEPEWLGTAGLTVRQIVFSEGAWAGLGIEKSLHRAREHGLSTQNLDLAAATAIAYLSVLQATTLERIQRENLLLTRSNLELARTRVAVGSATRADTFRFEAQIASDRRAVIAAGAQRNRAEIALNRLLNRPAEESFSLAETTVADTDLLTSNARFFELLETPESFRVFRRFMANEALENAPELRELREQLTAQIREEESAERAFYSPTVSLEGQVNYKLFDAGAGSTPPPMIDVPDLTWSVSAVLTLPLIEGGGRFARREAARRQASALMRERDGIMNRVAERLAASLHSLGAAYAAIRLSREAAEAAHKSLDLVQDSYGQGQEPITRLLEAQNASLVADQVAANAVFNFLIEWMSVQRAVGRFDVFTDPAERKKYVDRAHAFAKGQAND